MSIVNQEPSKQRLHAGEIEAQRRFGAQDDWNEYNLSMIRSDLPKPWQAFIESQAFFFISTANDKGECDCSFRGREMNASGEAYPLLKVIDAETLVFPEYRGNMLFNSLGNLLVNPHIGLLFIDFENRSRARVNGTARIIDDKFAYESIWPLALRYVEVKV
ncbi:pyridoxamine 5'-phosphate oxidase family protein [Thiomicrorhabdus sp.]|uniref:pyridoxamine 5'-phosphate oxidase family protein n=1 Tax=Thiomicrorhabdus sp. TaxID=2039724 RepID=UPI0029C6A0BD|nr:pyridoxamine 5'-phosphate oxidase family protein [Thiomicrorhabdus sp.]